jgi:hypothetical protein
MRPTYPEWRMASIGPQGRFAPLRGGPWPSLTASRRPMRWCVAGRDGGMVTSVEHRDDVLGNLR